jgi:hypothetical protein
VLDKDFGELNLNLVYNIKYFIFENHINHFIMKKAIFIISLSMVSFITFGQISSQEAIKKLSFMEGKWEGKSNVSTGPGQTLELDQYENVEIRMDGKLMAFEGKGYNEGELEFNAFAVITFDESKQEYEMQSWLATGQKTDAYVRLLDDRKWEWGFEVPQGKIRYFITLNEKGQWYEVGEFSSDGATWYPSFNMLLDKK